MGRDSEDIFVVLDGLSGGCVCRGNSFIGGCLGVKGGGRLLFFGGVVW